jgi:hypothetical protein
MDVKASAPLFYPVEIMWKEEEKQQVEGLYGMELNG